MKTSLTLTNHVWVCGGWVTFFNVRVWVFFYFFVILEGKLLDEYSVQC